MAQFELAADALRNMEDGANKTAIAYKLFGGRNIELLTAIERGKEGIKEMAEEAKRFGLVLSKEMVLAVEDANDSIARTKSLFTGVSNHMTVALAPAITAVSDALREKLLMYVEKTHGSMAEFGRWLGTEFIKLIGKVLEAFIRAKYVFINFGNNLDNIGAKWHNFGTHMLAALGPSGWPLAAKRGFKEIKDTVKTDSTEMMEDILNMQNLIKEMTTASRGDDLKELETGTAKKVKAIDTFHDRMEEYVHQERRFDLARLRSTEETEKAKKALRDKARLDISNNLEGTLTIMSGHSKKAFKMLQAYHISKAIMETYAAVMVAFKSYPPPYNFLAAGAALAFGMAQVGQIKAQKFTARRQGGMVSENKPYMVGEGGPETFIPNSAGYISPGVGGKNVNVTFNINAVDTTGFQQLLSNERGMIVGMINSAVNQQGKSDII